MQAGRMLAALLVLLVDFRFEIGTDYHNEWCMTTGNGSCGLPHESHYCAAWHNTSYAQSISMRQFAVRFHNE